jgi:hypothetical protein
LTRDTPKWTDWNRARIRSNLAPGMAPEDVQNVRIIFLSWSPVTESNRRPSPYHGDALPTELTGPVFNCRVAPSRAPRREHSASCAVVMRSTLRTGAVGRGGVRMYRRRSRASTVSVPQARPAGRGTRWVDGRNGCSAPPRPMTQILSFGGIPRGRAVQNTTAARQVRRGGNGDTRRTAIGLRPASVTARSSGSRWRCRSCCPSTTGWRWHRGRRG